MKIVTVVGARPQFIKVAAVRRAMEAYNSTTQGERLHDVLIHTGQHYDANMSPIFFQQLGISPPSYHFEVGGLSHGAMTGRMLEQVEKALMQEQPDWVLVYGDTNSTLAGALAAAKLCIPLAHVEAGLRSFNRTMPEEINRRLTDHCANLLLTTHRRATEQLLQEGISRHEIHEIGDVMCDIARSYREQGALGEDWVSSLGLTPNHYLLVTIHRASNTDDRSRLQSIMDDLHRISKEMPVLFPVHPRTRQALERISFKPSPNMHLIDAVGYLEMVALETSARMIVTDSGGVQKEAYFCQVPCLILREETEWVELVEHGYSRLVKDLSELVTLFQTMRSQTFDWNTTLYGDGHAARKLVEILVAR